MDEERIIEERKEKLLHIVKKQWVWVSVILIIALLLGIYIRTLPLQTRADTGKPGLWDITTNDYTLGPDLDPWLFTRYAKTMIETGSLPKMDMMRYTPLGFDTTMELQMVSYMIVITYKILNTFGHYSENYAAAFMPVILFALTIISFFFFVREIFIENKKKDDILEEGKKSHTRANLIALISTFFMIVSPIFLSRTIAGIPEKESVAFFFMFLAFFLFLKAWKTEKLSIAIILGILSGVATALMGLTWGGVSYIYVTISLASFAGFILNKVGKKEAIVYSLWIVFSLILTFMFTNRFSIKGFLLSVDTGFCFIVLFIFLIDYLLWNTKIKENKFVQDSKLPKNILSLIIAIIVFIIFALVFLGPNEIMQKASGLYQTLIKPAQGRWNTTVAENRQPYFNEWAGSFGPFIGSIPIIFWLFFIGSVILFKKMLHKIQNKDAWTLTGFYIFFFIGLVFSRYSGSSVFNGEGFISKLFYFGSAILLIGALFYYYNKYHKEKHSGFEEIEFSYVFLFCLFVLCLFTARSAVRLIMVLGPIAPIFVSFLIVFLIYEFFKMQKEIGKDETAKLVFGISAVLVLILSFYSFYGYYGQVTGEAKSFIPGQYNQQWQKAMAWVRTNTPENAVFSHWWDYGYWVQSIGERATMVDGGNSFAYWNYLVGRYVLTGDNEKDALDLLYAHNVSYFLVDSSDIGKYSAFSSIGSEGKKNTCDPDSECDRFSWVPTMTSDSAKGIQETANGIKRVYQGGSVIDEDINYDLNGTNIFLPAQKAGIAGIIIEYKNSDNKTGVIQPQAVFVYNNQQIMIPLRYAYINGELIDFKTGLEGTAFIIQNIIQGNQGIQVDQTGALMYFSPRMTRGFFTQVYIMNDPNKKFTHFKLTYSEPDMIIASLNNQGAKLNEFVYFQGVRGPIKIWNVEYTGNEKIRQEFIDTDASKYLSWQL